MLRLEIRHGKAGVVAAPAVELQRRVVTGIAEDDGAQLSVRRFHFEHGHIVIDRAARVGVVDKTAGRRLAAIDGKAGRALGGGEACGLEVVDRIDNRLDHPAA